MLKSIQLANSYAADKMIGNASPEKLLEFFSLISSEQYFGGVFFDGGLTARFILPISCGGCHIDASLLGKDIGDFVSCGLFSNYADIARECLNSGKTKEIEFSCDSNTFMHANVIPCSIDLISGVMIALHDCTPEKQMETILELEKEKFRILTDTIDCALWEYDIATHTLLQTRKFRGRYSEDNLNIPDYYNKMMEWNLIHPDDVQIFKEYCSAMDRGEKTVDFTLRALSDNDDYIYMRFQGSSVSDNNGVPFRIVGKTLNVDAEKKEYNRLLSKSEHDPLTNLLNRSATKERIEKCFTRTQGNEEHLLLIIDIDNFKQSNDRWGHLYGDYVLEEFSSRLANLFLPTDVIGRIGGDEFVVLRKGLRDYESTDKIIEAIFSMTADKIGGLKEGHNLTCSVGAAIYPIHGSNYETLFKSADIALYRAKNCGKNRFVIYSSDLVFMQEFGETELKKFDESSRDASPSTLERFDVERRLADFALNLINEKRDISVAVAEIFDEIGKFYGLGRICIVEKDVMTGKVCINHEWCGNGAASMRSILEQHGEDLWQELCIHHKSEAIFRCDDVFHSDEMSDRILTIYSLLGTKGTMHYGLFDSDKMIACLVFNTTGTLRRWTNSEVATLTTVAKILSSHLLRNRSKIELENEIFFMQSMINNQRLSNYAIKPYTYEILYATEYTEKLFPYLKLGETCYRTIMHRDTPCDFCPVRGLSDSVSRYTTEFYSNENEAWFSTTASTVMSPSGEHMYLVCWSDVTGFVERVKSKDTLTGLLTFERFEAESLKLISTDRKKYAIDYFDVSRFKYINNEWGYSAGNELLKFIARIMSMSLSSDERICRITGDTFIALLEYTDEEALRERLTSNFLVQYSQMKERFPKINPVISSGLYFLKNGEHDLSVAIDKANAARKTVKSFHKSALAVFDEKLNYRLNREKEIENKMHESLANDEFRIFIQPKVNLANGKIIGAEALLRWILPDGRTIMPMDFIPVFERNGFIAELDFFVYDKVFAEMRRWLDMGVSPVTVSVNVSRVHINETQFRDKLLSLLNVYDIPAYYIELELTESIFFDDLQPLSKLMSQLRSDGFSISIDDFGSGYSSLNLLKTLPVDIIKLDKEFFLSRTMDDRDKTVISSIISLAKGLGLKVISEGVETPEQIRYLSDIGCDMAQGFYFYKPMPISDFEHLLDKGRPWI